MSKCSVRSAGPSLARVVQQSLTFPALSNTLEGLSYLIAVQFLTSWWDIAVIDHLEGRLPEHFFSSAMKMEQMREYASAMSTFLRDMGLCLLKVGTIRYHVKVPRCVGYPEKSLPDVVGGYWTVPDCTALHYNSDTEHMPSVRTQQSIGITPGVCEMPNLGYVIAVRTSGPNQQPISRPRAIPRPGPQMQA